MSGKQKAKSFSVAQKQLVDDNTSIKKLNCEVLGSAFALAFLFSETNLKGYRIYLAVRGGLFPGGFSLRRF